MSDADCIQYIVEFSRRRLASYEAQYQQSPFYTMEVNGEPIAFADTLQEIVEQLKGYEKFQPKP